MRIFQAVGLISRVFELDRYVQCTMSMILLLTVGGTPFDAMHRYAPICRRLTLVMLKTGPSTLVTEIKSNVHMNI